MYSRSSIIFDSYYFFSKADHHFTSYTDEGGTDDYGEIELTRQGNKPVVLTLSRPFSQKLQRIENLHYVRSTPVGHITSLFHLRGNLYYGDFLGTEDLMIFTLGAHLEDFEVFIAKGKKRHQEAVINQLLEGNLTAEMNYFRRQFRGPDNYGGAAA